MVVTKHTAITQLLKLNHPSETRLALLKLIQRAYQKNVELELDHLCYIMHFFASNLDADLETPIQFYILCLRLDKLE
jgi:hypothetical protein